MEQSNLNPTVANARKRFEKIVFIEMNNILCFYVNENRGETEGNYEMTF